jgi:hypothetical protein
MRHFFGNHLPLAHTFLTNSTKLSQENKWLIHGKGLTKESQQQHRRASETALLSFSLFHSPRMARREFDLYATIGKIASRGGR